MWWPHYLLWHHQIILLRSIDSFLALDCSHTKLRLLQTRSCADLSDWSYITNASGHVITLSSKLFNGTWSILIFAWNFRTISLQSNHTSTNANYRILMSRTLIVSILWILTTTLMALVSQTAAHHVRRMVWLISASLHHHVTSSNNIVFFNYCDSILTTELLVHALAVILLGLDDVTS